MTANNLERINPLTLYFNTKNCNVDNFSFVNVIIEIEDEEIFNAGCFCKKGVLFRKKQLWL